MIWPAVIGGIASFAGNLFKNKQSKAAAREQMAFQERMSSTAYQRGMADMKAAGLNPILAGKVGGASAPVGAMPNITSVTEGLAHSAKELAGLPQVKASIANIQAETLNKIEQAKILAEKAEQERITTARMRIFQPAYEKAGQITHGVSDVADQVYDWVTGVNTGVSERGKPHSARSQSEAGKYLRGEKSFLQSLKDANNPANRIRNKRKTKERKKALEEAFRHYRWRVQ